MSEEQNSERPEKMAVRWDLNMGTVITVVMALAGGAFWTNTKITSLEERVRQGEDYRVSRTTSTDKSFVELTTAVRSLEAALNKISSESTNLNYRMGQNEANLNAVNSRVDRTGESMISSVESLKKDLTSLSIKVEVMTQKIDSLDVPRSPTRRMNLIKPLLLEGCIHIPPQRISFPTDPLFPYLSGSARHCD